MNDFCIQWGVQYTSETSVNTIHFTYAFNYVSAFTYTLDTSWGSSASHEFARTASNTNIAIEDITVSGRYANIYWIALGQFAS